MEIEYLDMKLTNLMCDRDSRNADVKIMLKQRNIYCDSAKRLYGKLTALHHFRILARTNIGNFCHFGIRNGES